jgi:hypothetical protein
MPSGGNAVLVGAQTPVDGAYVSDAATWGELPASQRAELERKLAAEATSVDASACAQTTSDLHVTVAPPSSGGDGVSGGATSARLVSVTAMRPAASSPCIPGPQGTTQCDTLFGFGNDTTPLTVSGNIAYRGTPVCLSYSGGQLCNGWFGVLGADGTLDNGNTGSGIGSSALALMSFGAVRAQVSSDPTAIYISHAPAGQSSSVTVGSYATLLDVTLETSSDSAQCAPTTISDSIVTPNVSTPAQYGQSPVSCVDELSVDGRHDVAADSTSFAALRAAQFELIGNQGADALNKLAFAALSSHQTLIGTPHTGLPAPGVADSAGLLSAACPILNQGLAPGTEPSAAFACTQSAIAPWHGVVLGQSLVSSRLTTTGYVQSASGSGAIHLILAFNTVDVHECWPAADCH